MAPLASFVVVVLVLVLVVLVARNRIRPAVSDVVEAHRRDFMRGRRCPDVEGLSKPARVFV